MTEKQLQRLKDPLVFAKMLWPRVRWYREQKEILYSVLETRETFVPAGNQLGKDFVGGFIALWWFLTHRECRVITTSVKDDHLRVLWGEINRFIQTSQIPLLEKEGGPLIKKFRDIRKLIDGRECEISYIRGMVSEKGEGLAGHHAEATMCLIDEASGVDDIVYTQQATWAKRLLVIGNPMPCQNFFKMAVDGGDLEIKE